MRKSAGIVAHSGKRFGALGRSTEAFNTSKIVFKEGLILAYDGLAYIKRMVTFADLLVETFSRVQIKAGRLLAHTRIEVTQRNNDCLSLLAQHVVASNRDLTLAL